MKRSLMATMVPPLALRHYGAAGMTAAPIGVVWVGSLVAIGHGLLLGGPGVVLVGIVLWFIASCWARLVLRGVEYDLHHAPESTHDHQVPPRADDPDPLRQVDDRR